MRTQYAQLMPGDTNAAILYTTNTQSAGSIGKDLTGSGVVRVCNTSSGDLTFRLFHDRQGQTQGTGTALYYDELIRANTGRTFPVAGLRKPGESLSVRSSSANNITFTYEAG